ncbi:hypothetical protein H2198_006054 [Neophaeococcomyces mojaviensis]|uniref:Uncharacterized protein n=1 Tax=Neophaeococcomyces mojaviensis TaxID=3383035 RepID=A0ACC3A3Z2_9EURO|nr:hypothetical protein H2198_006054 [Knufia sp. JES_112]
MATEAPSITRSSLRSSHFGLSQVSNSLSVKTDQARAVNLSTSTTPISHGSQRTDLLDTPPSSKTSLSLLDGTDYRPSTSKSPERRISHMARTKKLARSQQTLDPVPFPASPTFAVESTPNETTGRSRRKVKPTEKAYELHNDPSSKYYASLETDEEIQTHNGNQTASTKLMKERKRSFSEEAFKPSAPPLKRSKREQSAPSGGHSAQSELERPKPSSKRKRAMSSSSEEDYDGQSLPSSKKRKQEKTASPEIRPDEHRTKKSITKRGTKPTRNNGKGITGKDEAKPDTVIEVSDGGEVGTKSVSTNSKPEAVTESAADSQTARLVLKVQKQNNDPPQTNRRLLVTRNNSLVTIRLPSTILRQFAIPPHPSSAPAPSTATKLPTAQSDDSTGLFGFSFTSLPCKLCCLEDPAVRALAVATAIAQMSDPGAEDEEDESFDMDDFEKCLTRQCVCSGKWKPGQVYKLQYSVQPA